MSRILFSCFGDVYLHGVLSNNPHSLTYQVSNIYGIASGILDPAASGSAYPSPLFVLVAPFH